MLSNKERRRIAACERVVAGDLTSSDAALCLGISTRQMRRSVRRFEQHGDSGLVHGLRGYPSNKGVDATLKATVLARYEERYADFGPTLAAEKLQAEGLVVHHETLRRWLDAAGLWEAKPRRVRHRAARERMTHFGELVQFDGSPHDWFEGRRPKCCLMQMVDDATGVREALLCESEATEAAMRLLIRWIERHGVPAALYTDHSTVYLVNREPTLEEQLAAPGRSPRSESHASGSEYRSWGHPPLRSKAGSSGPTEWPQDRFVKELRWPTRPRSRRATM